MKHIILIAALAVLATGCYNDKYDKLYPGTGVVLCDTTSVTFTNDVQPIFAANCNNAGCHDVATSSGGYNFTTYAGSQSAVLNGKLSGCINWTPGFSAMPKNLPKLTPCEINKIQRWINQGALNN